ncbi:MAG: AMP-dependent synthetase/ligase [Burkholderiales bacterium]
MHQVDIIPVATARTLSGMFRERVLRTPDAVAYREFNTRHDNWRDYTWAQMQRQITRWQAALRGEALQPGERVALMLKNCTAWVMMDQAALGLGLVVVPLYTVDRPDNVAYILKDAGIKLLLLENQEQWQQLNAVRAQWEDCGLRRILVLNGVGGENDERLMAVEDWLPEAGAADMQTLGQSEELATIVYTSGTTGRPKGVMLSHRNILSNSYSSLQILPVHTDDLFLSFLPLSHTLERTVGYYLAVMAGAATVYARSIPQLAEDLASQRPTLLVSVPRIYERVYAGIKTKLDEGSGLKRFLFNLTVDVGWSRFEHAQGRGPWGFSHMLWPLLNQLVASKVMARLGGRIRGAMSGGAALPPDISRIFIGLGLPLLQGYGLTETSPVACGNPRENNMPASIGLPIPGVEVKIGEKNALLIRGPNIMLGYWNNPQATRAMIDAEGWLNSGDTARLDEQGRVYITGRLKEIIVMSNGEKVPPVDMEAAIARDSLFEQSLVLGEGKPYLALLAVLNAEQWKKTAREAGLGAADLENEKTQKLVLERVARQVRDFPGYAQIRRAALTLEPWTVENGLLTPTLKLKRTRIMEQYRGKIEKLYEGH